MSAHTKKRKPASMTTFAYALPDPALNLIEEAVCQICSMPMVDPRILSCCAEAFCFDCLLNLPDGLCPTDRTPVGAVEELPKLAIKIVLRRLGALLVFCPNRALGECDWKGARENLEEHIARTCQNTPCAHVADGCKWQGRARDVQSHVNDECHFRRQRVAERADLAQPDVESDEHCVGNPERLRLARWILNEVASISTTHPASADGQ